MLEDYEGSRAEFLKMLAENDGPPAYLLRAQRVEAVWESLLQECQREQDELLAMPRTRLAQVAALIDCRWPLMQQFVQGDDMQEYLHGLYTRWQPKLRVAVAPNHSPRKIRASLKDLCASFTRFNRLWERYVSEVSLGEVNYERREYNDYYLVEKAAAMGSDRLAEMGFERLADCTTEDVLAAIPSLQVPLLR